MIYVVLGGQYGSEGKGEFVNWFAHHLNPTVEQHVVRTGGPNAGHTVTNEHGTFKMRHIPTPWAAKNTILHIGAGSLIDLEVL